MAVPIIKNGFTTGEIAPSLYGRTELPQFGSAASTMRNAFVSYRGGAYSRGGLAFVGYSKQTTIENGTPPRLIPFQFSINQGLILEFGNYYMRVISDGALVTENALNITGITQADPAFVSASASAASTAAPVNSATSSSYAPGDTIVLSGGSYTVPAELLVVNTQLLSIQGYSGVNYAPGDTITLAGGTQFGSPPVVTVTTTQVVGLPTIVNPGTGGVPGVVTVTGTTGAGTKFQATVTVTASLAAAPNNGGVTSSYAAGDTVTLAGGTYTAQAVVQVVHSSLIKVTPLNNGTGYAPGDTITLSGGQTFNAPVATVVTTQVVGLPTIAAAGTGGTAGTATVTGTTGTGTKFQANVTIAGGSITAVNSLTVAGSYTVNPTAPSAEPVTGGGLTGAKLNITLGIATTTYTGGQRFTANPTGGVFTQAGTSGSGTGATFTGLFGIYDVTFNTDGTYTVLPSNPVAQAATSGSGFGVTFTLTNTSGITAVNSLTVAGSYTANPTTPAAEPVTGGSLSGAQLGLIMSVATVTVTSAGIFTANPAGGAMAQSATSGSGTGATFNSALLGPNTLSVVNPGTYSVPPANPAQQASTSGNGFGCTFNLTTASATPFNNQDWVYLTGIGGMTELNGRVCVVSGATTGGFELFDVFGGGISTASGPAYTSGGTASRVYTLATPWAAVDLPYLKFTQSADVMSLCCVNQDTGTEYPPYDLARLADNNWTITQSTFAASIATPANFTVTPNNYDGYNALFAATYYVTAVDSTTDEESVATIPIQVGNNFLGAVNHNNVYPSNVLAWNPVPNASYYNIYREQLQPYVTSKGPPAPTYVAGYIGQTATTNFTDPGYTPAYSQVPPQHQNPFARGSIVGAQITNGGSGWIVYQPEYSTVNTSTGTGAKLIAGINTVNNTVGSIYIVNGGYGYEATDTINILGQGSGAAAKLIVGPESGTYPGSVSYFQERRVYASTLNNPDSYWMSKSGLYLNFDTSFPIQASDAISGSPWSVEVDGIQWMINMPGGLVVLTGSSAWQLTGAGGSSLNPQPITPADQQAQPQAYNGCSATVPPIKIDDSILYVQAKGSIYREFTYQYFSNIYTGVDLTQLSSHLFTGHTIREHAYCEEPYKIIWAVRDDGVLLSLTYLKTEQVSGWARHDTNGVFVSCAKVTELPVDALYVVVQRVINGNTGYFIERMDNRIWFKVEDAFCVDAGLTYPQPAPNAFCYANSPYGAGAISGATIISGGSGYSAGTTAAIVDANGTGPGTAATATLTISNGVIIGVATTSGGNYVNPALVISDPEGTGSGASIALTLNNTASFFASAPVFSAGNVGSIIRLGGGIAQITSYTSSTQVQANILVPIVDVFPNSGGPTSAPAVISQPPGSWTMTAPTTTVGGLWHLVGQAVTGLADGNVIAPQTVSANATITLPVAASAITVGLGFTAQIQGAYFSEGSAPTQGRRKRIPAASIRVELSKGLQIGCNMPDGAALSPPQIAPYWQNLFTVPDRRAATFNGLSVPLYTGDIRIPINGQFDTRGQIAVQQANPLPMTILAFIPEIDEGDLEESKQGKGPAGGGGANVIDTGYYYGPPI